MAINKHVIKDDSLDLKVQLWHCHSSDHHSSAQWTTPQLAQHILQKRGPIYLRYQSLGLESLPGDIYIFST